MPPVNEATLAIKDREGRVRGQLTIKLLPRAQKERSGGVAALVDESGNPERDPSLEPVQLLEGEEYLYWISSADGAASFTTDQEQLFQPDDDTGTRGRLRTGLYTGTVTVTFFVDGCELGTASFEVRSRKVDYLTHFRWMLRDVADCMAELVMESFARSEQRFAADAAHDAATLYQRFAFLRSVVMDEALEYAITLIANRPHRAWVDVGELRHPRQPIPASSAVASQLARPGPRVRGAAGSGVIPYPLPAQIEVVRTRETLDTEPNRFVRFALQQWRRLVQEVGDALGRSGAFGPRAEREVRAVLEKLDQYLYMTNFPGVSELTRFPAGNMVLLRAEGYRTVLQLYLQVEMAARLAWSGGDDVYRAGQRDIATLYEYWVYLHLVRIIASLTGVRVDYRSLVRVADDGLTVDLRRGRQHVVSGTVERLGRRLRLDLWFNRVFSPQRGGSWTRAMRPDFSLRIAPDGEGAAYAETWIHFDAKYRVETITQLFGDPGKEEGKPDALPGRESGVCGTSDAGGSPPEWENDTFGDAEDPRTGRPLRADLLKMHAYKDAIRRSSGAYVIYPGDEEECRFEYHEILPGLGAFPLRPSQDGSAAGSGVLARFIEDVIVHVASQVTQHERERYWVSQAHADPPPDRPGRMAAFLTKPPADTPVLLGYVKSAEHLAWIEGTGRYNLRADGRTGSVGLHAAELGAELVILYGPALPMAQVWRVVDGPQVMTRKRMEELGYPAPRGELYICLPVERVKGEWENRLPTTMVERLRERIAPERPYGAPAVTTWLRVVEACM